MRILDTKIDFEIALLQDAPTITSFLTPDDANHFDEVQIYLEALDVPFTLDTALVRGLDYYTRTTFEIISSKLGAQDALCGGGRYDKLAETLGGKQTPAVGFAAGLERILIAMDEVDTDQKIQADKIYLIGLGDAVRPTMLKILGEARKAGLIMEFDSLRRSIKSQMRGANKIGASLAIIIGDKELKDKSVQIKDLNNGQQESIPIDSIISYIKSLN
jgi:histidyl-tRNA synthetase